MKSLFKLNLIVFTFLLVVSCSSESEVGRQFKCKLDNQSGLKVKEAVIYFFNYEVPTYVGNEIIVSDLESGKAVDVQYNLEHTESFNDMTVKVVVEFEKPFVNKTLTSTFISINSRRATSDCTITIQQDTLLPQYVRK